MTAAFPVLSSETPLLLPLVAVTGSAWLLGIWPTMVGITVHALVVGRFWLQGPEHLAPLIIFASLAAGIAIVVSGRRDAMTALQRRTKQYQTLVDLSPDAIFVYKARQFTFANASAARLLGARDPEEIIGREAADFLVPEWRDLARELMATALAGAPTTGVEAAMLRVDGSRIEVSVTGARFDHDDPPAVLIVVRDASQSKAAEAKLAESNQLLKTAIEASPIAIVGWDAEGLVRMWNRAAEETFGWSRDEVIGRSLPFVPSQLQAEDREKVARLLQGEVLKAVETQRLRKDGSLVNVSLWTTALDSARGEVSVLALIADISENKKLLAQLLQSQKMEAVGRLAGGVAHDFNNLLTAILGYTEFVLERDIDDQARGDLEQVRRAAQSAATLTRQLLAFSRRQIMQPAVFDLRGHVAERQKMLRRMLGEDVEIRVTLGPSPVLVKADPGQLEQVVLNLAVNARDAMPDGGTLHIVASALELTQPYEIDGAVVEPGHYARLSVTDNGLGMPAEVQKRIFEPFFTTKQHGKGTGLGLATVYGIVKQSGGYIEVVSRPGAGTTFSVYLPLATDSLPETGPTESEKAPRGTETILLVEDDEALREFARKSLEIQGYATLVAPTPAEALTIARSHDRPIDLLLTDVVMPGMNGRALAHCLQELRPSMRVLYMSGYTDNAIVHHGVLEPGAEFLQKPFGAITLAHRVRKALSESPLPSNAVDTDRRPEAGS